MKNRHIILGLMVAIALILSGNAIGQQSPLCGDTAWVDQNVTRHLEIQLLQGGRVIPPGTPLTPDTHYTLRVRATYPGGSAFVRSFQ